MIPLFTFGTLMDPDVLDIVSGLDRTELQLTEAFAEGYVQREVATECYPVLLPAPDGRCKGRLIHGLSQHALDRILFYEGDEYELDRLTVSDSDGKRIDALFFRDAGIYEVLSTEWDFDNWRKYDKVEFLDRCRSYMRLLGQMSATEADRYW